MGKTKHIKATKSEKDSQSTNAAKIVLHVKPKHEDDHEITASTFPFNELIPDWCTLDPNNKNPAIGSRFASAHHGDSGGKKIFDFKTFRLAYCLESVNKDMAGANHRVHCMNVFTVDSNQCVTHGKTTHKDGPNKIYTCMKRKETATWGMVKDTNSNQPGAFVPKWQRADRRREAAAAELEEAVANDHEANIAWESVNAATADDIRITWRQDTALSRQDDNKVDLDLNGAAARRRAALDEKLKTGYMDRKKTRVKSVWGGTKLGGTRDFGQVVQEQGTVAQ